MPTLGQSLQERPDPKPPYLATVVTADNTTVTTDAGVVPNAIGTTPANGQVVVMEVEGREMAVGWLRA